MTKWEQHNQRLNDMGWMLPAFPEKKEHILWAPQLKMIDMQKFCADILSVQPMPSDVFLEPMWDGNGSMRAMSLVYRPQ